MADRGILFSGPMVRALLAGTKTQTRRLYVPKHEWTPEVRRTEVNALVWPIGGLGQQCGAPNPLPPYHTGDRLYVREAWRVPDYCDPTAPRDLQRGMSRLQYEADGYRQPRRGDWTAGKFRQAMHMPRWASRLWLNLTEVRVQRLHEISEADCLAEGIVVRETSAGFVGGYGDVAVSLSGSRLEAARAAYFMLLDSLHDAGFSASNPWLTAYTFTVHHQNIDQLEAA